MNEQEITNYVLSLIPKEEKDRVFKQEYCDIGTEFIGFMDTYYYLSKIIPKEYTVYDFGCAYNPQCYLFQDHAKFIAVNPEEIDGKEVFKAPNCDFYRMTTKQFLENIYEKKEKEFAICNYVPNWHKERSIDLVKLNFQNCYTFYPS